MSLVSFSLKNGSQHTQHIELSSWKSLLIGVGLSAKFVRHACTCTCPQSCSMASSISKISDSSLTSLDRNPSNSASQSALIVLPLKSMCSRVQVQHKIVGYAGKKFCRNVERRTLSSPTNYTNTQECERISAQSAFGNFPKLQGFHSSCSLFARSRIHRLRASFFRKFRSSRSSVPCCFENRDRKNKKINKSILVWNGERTATVLETKIVGPSC
jgi:hypothetical protein